MKVYGSIDSNDVKSLQSFRNLKIDCASNTQVVVKSGTTVLADSWDAVIECLADKTIDITASGANGLDTGSEAGNTWYYVWLILNPTSGVVAGLLSASAIAPTLPSGYTKKRLISAVRNDGSSNFRQYKQVGNRVYRNYTWDLLSSGIATGWTSIDVTSCIPINVCSVGTYVMQAWPASGTDFTSGVYMGFDGAYIAALGGRDESARSWGQNISVEMPHTSGGLIYYYVGDSREGCSISTTGFILDL